MNDNNIVILENRSEIAAGTRGASLGVDAMKIAAFNSKNDFFNRFTIQKIPDQNHLLWEDVRYRHAKRINGLLSVYQDVCKSVASVITGGRIPVVLSGDHASAGGTVAGIARALPDKKLGVVWIDAHADIHSPYTTPSGNIHGMPLAAALGTNNMDCHCNNVSNHTRQQWERLKMVSGKSPNLLPEHLVYVAVRSTEAAEDALIKEMKIRMIGVDELRQSGAEKTAKEIRDYLAACDILYYSFDVDSMDTSVSVGTGTPVPGGISEAEARELMVYLCADPRSTCFEITEVNPALDTGGNSMAESAFRILNASVGALQQNPKS